MIKPITRPQAKNLLITAFTSIRKEVRYSFLICVCSIAVIELVLKRFSSPYPVFTPVGEIYLKICYSIMASTIFFYINVQIPKEQKKLKTHLYIHHKLGRLHNEITFMFTRLGYVASSDKELTISQAEQLLSKTDPTLPVTGQRNLSHANWLDYLVSISKLAKNTASDLSSIHDIVDADILESIFYLERVFDMFDRMDGRIFSSSKKWKFIALDLCHIEKFNNRCASILGKYKNTMQQSMERYEKEFKPAN